MGGYYDEHDYYDKHDDSPQGNERHTTEVMCR